MVARPAMVAQMVAISVAKKASFNESHVASCTKVFRAASSYQLRPKWEKTATERVALKEKRISMTRGAYNPIRQNAAMDVNPGIRRTSKLLPDVWVNESSLIGMSCFIPYINYQSDHH